MHRKLQRGSSSVSYIDRRQRAHAVPRVLTMLVVTCLAAAMLPLYASAATSSTSPASASASSSAASDDPLHVRVGIVETYLYAEPDENGNERGYDADYTLKIAQYANLDVEWVVEDNYDALIEDLAKGTIDMAPGVSMTPEREQRFLFSDDWLGRGYLSICAAADDDRFEYGNIDQIQDARFAVLSGSSADEALQTWGRDHGFEPDVTEYATEGELESAVKQGDVDLMVYGGSPAPDGLRVVGKFDQTAYYMIFGSGKLDLKNRVDSAMMRISSEDVLYAQKLYQKYRSSSASAVAAFTAEEKDYIAAHPVIKVAVIDDCLPYCTKNDDGSFSGICVDYYRALAKSCGFDVEFVAYPSADAEIAAVVDGQADVVDITFDDVVDADDRGIILTSVYSMQTAVMLRNSEDAVEAVAVLDDEMPQVERGLEISDTNYDMVGCVNIDQCYDLLAADKVDAIICDMAEGTWLLNQHRSSELSMASLQQLSWGYCGAVASGNAVLGSVLSKANIAAGSRIEGIIAVNTQPEQNFSTFINRLPIWLLAVSAVIAVALIALVAALVFKTRRQRDQAALAKANSELVIARKARESEAAFLSNMSHDMRTPLNGIIGFTELALGTDDQEKRQRYLERIDGSGRFMLGLVNDVLDMSKIESDKMELHPQTFECGGLFDSVIDSTRILAKRQGVSFTANLCTSCPAFVYADRLRLQQVALNLLSNAVKYTPAGGSVTFEVQGSAVCDKPIESNVDDTGSSVCNMTMRVIDTGIGMSSGFQEHMFEPFSQERAAKGVGIAGTGLGLSIVKSIVGLMGGTIEAQSELGGGSTFTVHLPLTVVDAPESPDGSAKRTAGQPEYPVSLAGRRVLVAEDNDINAEVIATILSEGGHAEVLRAVNGQEAVGVFRNSCAGTVGRIDAILMDLRMPVMDGIEATKMIRAMDWLDARSVPIIAMTADAFDEDIRRCIDAGMDAHLSKPIDSQKMLATLEELITSRR